VVHLLDEASVRKERAEPSLVPVNRTIHAVESDCPEVCAARRLVEAVLHSEVYVLPRDTDPPRGRGLSSFPSARQRRKDFAIVEADLARDLGHFVRKRLPLGVCRSHVFGQAYSKPEKLVVPRTLVGFSKLSTPSSQIERQEPFDAMVLGNLDVLVGCGR